MSDSSPGRPAFEEPSELWRAVCETLRSSIEKDEIGVLERSLYQSVLGSKDCPAGPSAVLDPRTFEVAYHTRAFTELFGGDVENLSGRCTIASLLQPDDTNLDKLINSGRWDRFVKLATVSTRENSKAELAEEAGRQRFVMELFFGQGPDGKPCWYFLSGFVLAVPGFHTRLLVLIQRLETSTPKLLSQIAVQLDEQAVRAFLTKLQLDVQADVVSCIGQDHTKLCERIETRCDNFATMLSSALEGDHMVPLVGVEAVKAFEQLSGWEAVMGNMEQDLKTAWEVNDEVYRDTRCKGAKSIACAVSDPSGPDCPLVYISPGFESLTQYGRTFALGRNCRFLQPNVRSMNVDFNGEEIRRMKIFCVEQKTGQIINLLLNQSKDGEYFWNLLFMNHIKCKGVTHKNAKHYIFGVQTNVVVQKDLLDTFIMDAWKTGDGKKNLLALRDRFKKEEYKYSPKESSLKKLADSIISEWAFEVGQSNKSFWEGSHYVPVVGRPAVAEFIGAWPTLLEQAALAVRALFEMTERTYISMKENSDESVVCAVADPSYFDCPLVFLSKGFESMTGYRNEFALGRNCRFLQPNTGDLNKKINGDELGRMKEFCMAPRPKGLRIVNLLLNEKKTGERFWNLLHMEHVEVEGKPYILAVQTIMDMPLPSVIKDRETSQSIVEYDTAMLTTFMDELCMFLNQIRVMLRGQDIKSMLEAATYASQSIVNFMKRNCDDFEGDHLVPRLGKREVRNFELDITWKALLKKVSALLVEIWDVSEYNEEEVACAVSDPRGNDCPLVYVSHGFERMTGYPREWVLGRNCRFLQPNDAQRNMDFNEEDRLRMRAFCSEPQPEGTRIINLLVNEEKSGYPFWNLLVMEHVFVEDQNYIFGVQTKIDIETVRLAEIFGLDRDGKTELTRLRELMRSKEGKIEKTGMKALCESMVRQWVSTFPPHLEMPRFHVSGSGADAVSIPLAGLVISPDQPLPENIQAGLEDGVRHFALALNSEQYLEDASHVEQVGRLLSFRLAELLQTMRQKYLHYMRGTMTFTLITRPQYINSFKGISKALTSSGYHVCCWLLDVRAINPDRPLSKGAADKLKQCWQLMSTARRAGDVKAIGLYGPLGSIMVAMQTLKSIHPPSPVSVLAVDDFPRKEQDQMRLEKFRKLYCEEYGCPPLLTYGLYGQNNALLKSKTLQQHAEDMDMNVCTALLKWAEVQGYGALVSRVRDNDLEFNKGVKTDFHRGFTRDYSKAPAAAVCAANLDSAFEEIASQKEAEMIVAHHHSRASVTAGTRSSMMKAEMVETHAPKHQTDKRISVASGVTNRLFSSTDNSRRLSSMVHQVVANQKAGLPPIPGDEPARHKRASTGSHGIKARDKFASCNGVDALAKWPTKEELVQGYRNGAGKGKQENRRESEGKVRSQSPQNPDSSRRTSRIPTQTNPNGASSRRQSNESGHQPSRLSSKEAGIPFPESPRRRDKRSLTELSPRAFQQMQMLPDDDAEEQVCVRSNPGSRIGSRSSSFSSDDGGPGRQNSGKLEASPKNRSPSKQNDTPSFPNSPRGAPRNSKLLAQSNPSKPRPDGADSPEFSDSDSEKSPVPKRQNSELSTSGDFPRQISGLRERSQLAAQASRQASRQASEEKDAEKSDQAAKLQEAAPKREKRRGSTYSSDLSDSDKDKEAVSKPPTLPEGKKPDKPPSAARSARRSKTMEDGALRPEKQRAQRQRRTSTYSSDLSSDEEKERKASVEREFKEEKHRRVSRSKTTNHGETHRKASHEKAPGHEETRRRASHEKSATHEERHHRKASHEKAPGSEGTHGKAGHEKSASHEERHHRKTSHEKAPGHEERHSHEKAPSHEKPPSHEERHHRKASQEKVPNHEERHRKASHEKAPSHEETHRKASHEKAPNPEGTHLPMQPAGKKPEHQRPFPRTNKFCTECGTEHKPGAKFCSECGTRLGDATPATPSTQATKGFDDSWSTTDTLPDSRVAAA